MIIRKYTYLKLFIFAFICLLKHTCWSQQEPMYTQNNFDRLVFNPAYAGSSGWIVNTFKQGSLGIDNVSTVLFPVLVLSIIQVSPVIIGIGCFKGKIMSLIGDGGAV